jgi:hypothetical protein
VSEQRWLVTRQDDNGNVYVVAELATEAEARALAAELEARGHKQLYAVVPKDQ